MARAESNTGLNPGLAEKLAALLGKRFATGAAVRSQHGQDESWHHPALPDAVAFARSTEEVQAIVRVCTEHRTPIIPFGVGTSLEGGVTAPFGGVSLDLSQMNNVLDVRRDDMDCTVEAGVTRKQLDAHLRDSGLFFPIDPGADATIGGMAATRASGTNAVRYGTMRENVLALRAVLADGRAIDTGGRARKSAAGYDLTGLLVGSEGTLGIITEVTLRLHGRPEAIAAATVAFPTVAAAVDCCIATIQAGVPVARVELVDALQMQAINAYAGLSHAPSPTLFFEFHGSDGGVREQTALVQEIAGSEGGADFVWADRAEDRSRLWQARHDALYAALALKPGARAWSTDVCVPISALAACIGETRADLEQSHLIAPIVGHVGDGNFHVIMLLDPDKPDDLAEAHRLNDRLVARAIGMDGTCTGEHGIGLGKREWLAREFGEDGLRVMRAIKSAIDPAGLFNPGKLFVPPE